MSTLASWMDNNPTNADVVQYEHLRPSINSLFEEMRELSKKKPDGIATAFKLRLINKTLAEVRRLLHGDPSIEKVEELTEDSLPQYSDIVLVLGQFKAALERYYDRFTEYGKWQTVELLQRKKAAERKKAK